MTGGPSRAPASPPRPPMGSPDGSLSLPGERRAYHVPHEYQGMIEAPPVRRGRDIGGRRCGSASTWPPPLWAKPHSPFGVVDRTTVISGAQGCALSSPPRSRPPRGWQACTISHEARPPCSVRRHGPKRFRPSDDSGRMSWEGADGSTSGSVNRPLAYQRLRATSWRNPHRLGREACPHTVPRCRTLPYGKGAR